MTQRVGKFFSLIFCNLLSSLGRCSKFVNHPPHFRTQKVLDKAWEEADGLHLEAPGSSIQAATSTAEPTVGPVWDVMLKITGPNLDVIKGALVHGCEEAAKTKTP